MKRLLETLHLDPYLLLLIGTVILATLLPARGAMVDIADAAADIGIVALFFVHGAKLSRSAVLEGARHWRLHLAVAASTFILFPLLGLALKAAPILPPALASGVLFLTLLPSTVQSSIAFTAMARGNVAAAVCSASFSNLAGVFITPLLVALLMTGGHQHHASTSPAITIVLQLLLPFLAGHALHPRLGPWLAKRKPLTTIVDRGSILLVVYTAFSAAVVEGLWSRISAADMALLLAVLAVLLALVLGATFALGKWLGFDHADRIVLQFCGSKKSLASGVPMASVLFPAAQVGAIVLPLMVFHQVQLMACSLLATRYRENAESEPASTSASAA